MIPDKGVFSQETQLGIFYLKQKLLKWLDIFKSISHVAPAHLPVTVLRAFEMNLMSLQVVIIDN